MTGSLLIASYSHMQRLISRICRGHMASFHAFCRYLIFCEHWWIMPKALYRLVPGAFMPYTEGIGGIALIYQRTLLFSLFCPLFIFLSCHDTR